MTQREWNRLPWEGQPKASGWPWHGFVYTEGGVAKIRTPAGTVVPCPEFNRLPTPSNLAWKVKRPGWIAPPLDPAFVASEDASGRTWLDHGVSGAGQLLRQEASGATPYYVTSTGPVVRVLPQETVFGTLTPVVAMTSIELRDATHLTLLQDVPLNVADTLVPAQAEARAFVPWLCADMSDDGRISLWYLGDAIALLTLSGEVPTVTASVVAVSAKMFPDPRNMSHALLERTFSATGDSISLNGSIQDRDFGLTVETIRFARALRHDGDILFFESTSTFSGHEYTDFDVPVLCDATRSTHLRWRDTSGTVTAAYNGSSWTSHVVNGPPYTYAFEVSGLNRGPIVDLRSRDVVYLPEQTCAENVEVSNVVTASASYYKDAALGSYLGDLAAETFAVDPHTHELFIWPSGVVVV